MEKKMEIRLGDNLASVVYSLLAAKERGEHVYCEFNGHILHSDTVTMDGAYLEITGCSKEEFDFRRNALFEEMEEEERKAQDNISSWIERGKQIITEDKYKEWEKLVISHAKSLYYGSEVEASLVIMEKLEYGIDVNEVINIFKNQNHSGMSSSIVKQIVSKFSNRGKEFIEALYESDPSIENERLLVSKQEIDKEFKKVFIKRHV